MNALRRPSSPVEHFLFKEVALVCYKAGHFKWTEPFHSQGGDKVLVTFEANDVLDFRRSIVGRVICLDQDRGVTLMMGCSRVLDAVDENVAS